jgi:hypothetical protein
MLRTHLACREKRERERERDRERSKQTARERSQHCTNNSDPITSISVTEAKQCHCACSSISSSPTFVWPQRNRDPPAKIFRLTYNFVLRNLPKQTNSVVWVRDRTWPSDRYLSAKLVITFSVRGCNVVSVTEFTLKNYSYSVNLETSCCFWTKGLFESYKNSVYRPSHRRLSAKLVPTFLRLDGATWSAWWIPTAVFSVFWTWAATFTFQATPQLYPLGWVADWP